MLKVLENTWNQVQSVLLYWSPGPKGLCFGIFWRQYTWWKSNIAQHKPPIGWIYFIKQTLILLVSQLISPWSPVGGVSWRYRSPLGTLWVPLGRIGGKGGCRCDSSPAWTPTLEIGVQSCKFEFKVVKLSPKLEIRVRSCSLEPKVGQML